MSSVPGIEWLTKNRTINGARGVVNEVAEVSVPPPCWAKLTVSP